MRIKHLSVCLVALISFGCAQKPSAPDADGRLTKLFRQKKQEESRAEVNQFQKFVKAQRLEQKKMKLSRYKMPAKVTDETLYSEVLSKYQAQDSDGVEFYTEALVKRYPQSIFSDNALFLKGQLYLALGAPTEALREFERILQLYPMGNKRVSAIFGKAIAYRKLQLYGYAKKAYADIKKNYPGSPEFYRVPLEEKLLALEKGL